MDRCRSGRLGRGPHGRQVGFARRDGCTRGCRRFSRASCTTRLAWFDPAQCPLQHLDVTGERAVVDGQRVAEREALQIARQLARPRHRSPADEDGDHPQPRVERRRDLNAMDIALVIDPATTRFVLGQPGRTDEHQNDIARFERRRDHRAEVLAEINRVDVEEDPPRVDRCGQAIVQSTRPGRRIVSPVADEATDHDRLTIRSPTRRASRVRRFSVTEPPLTHARLSPRRLAALCELDAITHDGRRARSASLSQIRRDRPSSSAIACKRQQDGDR